MSTLVNIEIQAAIAARNNLHKKAILENSPLNWKDCRCARNRVVHPIRNAKRSFYPTQLKTVLKILKIAGSITVVLSPKKAGFH